MDGIILFADDHIHEDGRGENTLFKALNKQYPIVGVHTLELAEKAINSTGLYTAIICDWEFTKERNIADLGDDDDLSSIRGLRVEPLNPFNLLMQSNFYSPIYIYSQQDIPEPNKSKLEEKFGNRIKFRLKDNISEESEKNEIIKVIEEWIYENKKISISLAWSSVTTKAVQQILKELGEANEDWVKEIHSTACTDGGDGNLEVIEIFMNLLSEAVIQDHKLLQVIGDFTRESEKNLNNTPVASDEKSRSIAKLYNRIYYTKLINSPPVMTGDIFKIDDEKFALLITPECDLKDRIKADLIDFLLVKKGDFEIYINKTFSYAREDYETKKKSKVIGGLLKIFNQDISKYHILPSFPFTNNMYKEAALINFTLGFVQLKYSDLKLETREFKLNSPYIHQLRQRFLAQTGRIGVPAIPGSLRIYNIN